MLHRGQSLPALALFDQADQSPKSMLPQVRDNARTARAHCHGVANPRALTFRAFARSSLFRTIAWRVLKVCSGLAQIQSAGVSQLSVGKCDEPAEAFHSITSSASERRLSEILTPSAFAVVRLITSSNLVTWIAAARSRPRVAGFAVGYVLTARFHFIAHRGTGPGAPTFNRARKQDRISNPRGSVRRYPSLLATRCP